MKYKLKKDLPFAQAGEQARCFYGSSVFSITYRMDSVDFNLTSEEYIDKLIRDGWIEEVKPREWVLEIDTSLCGEVSHAVRPANAKGRMLHKDSEIIKVREVIEWVK